MTRLEQLPARIDDLTSQIVQLRAEMRDEFSAVNLRISEQGTTLRQEMAEQGNALRQEIADLATHMRVLHEEVISRFVQLQDAWPLPPRRRPKKK